VPADDRSRHRRPSLRVFNCSDGARIQGAEPLRPESLSLSDPPLDRAAFNREIRLAWPVRDPTSLVGNGQLREALSDSAVVFHNFENALSRLGTDCTSLVTIWQAIAPFLDERRALGPAAAMIFGTATTLLTLGSWYIHRMPDEDRRQALLQRFLAEYRRVFATLGPEALALLTRCAAALSDPTPGAPP